MKLEDENADLRAQSVSSISNLYLHFSIVSKGGKFAVHINKKASTHGKIGGMRKHFININMHIFIAVFPQVGGGLCGMPIT